jgi:hypothetical protein
MKLVSLTTLQSYLDIPTDTTSNYVNEDFDTLLNYLIEFVSSRIENFLNRNLELTERTEYCESGRRKYYLSSFPIINPSTMTVKVDTSTETFESDYYVREDEGLLEFEYKTTYIRPKEIEVTYRGGYTETDGVLNVPSSLQYACMLQCAFIFRKRKEIGMAWVGTPDVNRISTDYGGMDLLKEVKEILMKYRRIPGDR